MEIKQEEIKYNNQVPFNAQICSIDRMAPHYHETSLELIFCLEGSINYVAGLQKGTVSSGQIFSIDCEDIHYLYSDVPNTVLIFHMDLTDMDKQWEDLHYIFFSCESAHCFPYQQASMNRVKDMILALSVEHFADNPHPEESRQTANELLELLIRYFNVYNYYNPDDYMNEVLRDRFYSILRYCFENYNKKITVAHLAEHTHINKNYLSQYIGNTSFGSFSSMLKNIRCYKAERLLLTTSMPNTEIAYACGFSDPKYMYSAFETWWGCSPHTHRKNYRKYMSQQESYEILDTDDSAIRVQNYIINWHLEKIILHH